MVCYTDGVGILDFIYPKHCVNCRKIGDYVCPNCFVYLSFEEGAICLVCKKSSVDGLTHPGCEAKYSINGAFSSLKYKGIVKKLIYRFKYNPYLTGLKDFLGDLFYEGLIQKEEFMRIYKKQNLVMVPIPLYKERLRRRGYNQSEILAKELSKKLNIKAENLLIRIKETNSQVGLKQKERQENISGAFKINPNSPISCRSNILLVDDVLTTGSTLLEAAKILKKNGVKNVWGITLARD